jgi:site-specific recombinase XerC
MADIVVPKEPPSREKRPIVTEDMRRIVERLPQSLQGTRDRALLLMGFAEAFRRSELVGLDIGDRPPVENRPGRAEKAGRV